MHILHCTSTGKNGWLTSRIWIVLPLNSVPWSSLIAFSASSLCRNWTTLWEKKLSSGFDFTWKQQITCTLLYNNSNRLLSQGLNHHSFHDILFYSNCGKFIILLSFIISRISSLIQWIMYWKGWKFWSEHI